MTIKILETAMGHPREDMTQLVEGLQMTVQEHIWKVYAYHKSNPQDMRGWLISLNKHLVKLRTFNIQKGNASKLNLDREYLLDKLQLELFESGDLNLLNHTWKARGYPFVTLEAQDMARINLLATRYVDLILSNSGALQVHTSELHE